MEAPPIPVVPAGTEPLAPAPPSGNESAMDTPRPTLEPQHVLNAIWRHWLEGVSAHHPVADKLLCCFSTTLTPLQLRGVLGWTFHERWDVAWYLQWWLDHRQTSGKEPADTLQDLQQFLAQLEQVPNPKRPHSKLLRYGSFVELRLRGVKT